MYAIIKLAGKQYKVEEGQPLLVNRLDKDEGDSITVDEVLLVDDGEKPKIGTPLVDSASVTLDVVKHQKADKIRVAKYKAKSRQRSVYGHRQHQTLLEVTKIKA